MTDVYQLNYFNGTFVFIGDLEVTKAGNLLYKCNLCGGSVEKVPLVKLIY